MVSVELCLLSFFIFASFKLLLFLIVVSDIRLRLVLWRFIFKELIHSVEEFLFGVQF